MMYRQGDVGLTAQGSVDSLEEDAESLNQTVLDHMEKLCTFDREKTIEVCVAMENNCYWLVVSLVIKNEGRQWMGKDLKYPEKKPPHWNT